MTKKSKSTKQIRAIDRIIKFQIDDGIESLTISGKEVLADVAIDRQSNVTLFLNADPDKINEIQSLVPFVTVQTVAGGTETDKTKTVTLSQDLTQFALEIADNSKELASLIKTQSSIVLDLNGLVQKLLEIAGKLAELEQKNLEQDNRLTAIEAKDLEQDNRLTVLKEKNDSQDERLNDIDVTQEAHASKLKAIEDKNVEQDNKLATIETEQAEHASKLATIEQSSGASVDLTPLEQRIANAESMASGLGIQIANIEQITGGLSFKDTELDSRVTTLENKEQGTGQAQEQLYNVSTGHFERDTTPQNFTLYIIDGDDPSNIVFGYVTIMYNQKHHFIPLNPLTETSGGMGLRYFITSTGGGIVRDAFKDVNADINVSFSQGVYNVNVALYHFPTPTINEKLYINSVLFRRTPQPTYTHTLNFTSYED